MIRCICVRLSKGDSPARIARWAENLHPYMAERIHNTMVRWFSGDAEIKVTIDALARVRSHTDGTETYGAFHQRTREGLPCGCRGEDRDGEPPFLYD